MAQAVLIGADIQTGLLNYVAYQYNCFTVYEAAFDNPSRNFHCQMLSFCWLLRFLFRFCHAAACVSISIGESAQMQLNEQVRQSEVWRYVKLFSTLVLSLN